MSTDLGVMGARVNLITSGFERGVRTIRQGFQGLGQKAMHLNQSLELLQKGFHFLTGATQKSLGPFIEAANVAENYRLRLNILLGSQEEGARMFDTMSKFAAKVPFEYEKIMSAATNLGGVMKGGVDEVNEWMPLIADLAAVSGMTIEDTTNQVVRMYSSGSGAAEQFRDRGILAMLGFEQGATASAAETRKKLIEAFESPTSTFRGAAAELAKTWAGLMSMFGDKWFAFRLSVMDSGVFGAIKESLMEVLTQIDELKDNGKLDVWAKDMALGMISAFSLVAEAVSLLASSINSVGFLVNKARENHYKSQVTGLRKHLNEVDRLYQLASKNTLANPFPDATSEQLKEIQEARRTLDRMMGGEHGAWRDAPKWMHELAAQILPLENAYFDLADAVDRNIERQARWTDILERTRAGIEKTSEGVKNYDATVKAGEASTRKGGSGVRVLSKEATDGIEELKKALGQVQLDEMLVGLNAWEGAQQSINFEIAEMRKQYANLISEAPEIAGLIDKIKEGKEATSAATFGKEAADILDQQAFAMKELTLSSRPYEQALAQINREYATMRGAGGPLAEIADQWREAQLAQLNYGTQIEADTIMKSQAEEMENLLLVTQPYTLELMEINRQYQQMIESGGPMADTAEKWRENQKALSAYRETIQSVMEITDAMVTHFASAFAEFAKTGKMNLKDLGKALLGELQMIAAQKTAQALMDATHAGIMYLIAMAKKDTEGMANWGKAGAVALAGATTYAGFVAGSGIAGIAHGGMTSIPEDGTWLLQKNERVVDANTNADLKDYLKKGSRGDLNLTVNINDGDQKSVEKALPKLRETILEVWLGDYSGGGLTYQTVQQMGR